MLTVEKVWRPKDLYDAWSIHQTYKDASCFVSGGTWLRTQWKGGLRHISPHLISLDQIHDMDKIEEKNTSDRSELLIGSMTKLADCIKHPLLNKYGSAIVEACKRIAAPSIRNQGTIGGNILTKTGDSLPALLIHDATLTWFNGKEFENESLEVYLSNAKYKEVNGVYHPKILVSIAIPLIKNKPQNRFSFYQKVGKREAFTPSIITIAGTGNFAANKQIGTCLLAAGGGTSVPFRLTSTELALENNDLTKDFLQHIQSVIYRELQREDSTISEYKKKVTANLIVYHLFSSLKNL
ncbi:FAD binding domain-containing protein [Evansella sp. AB-P1]|uniref:FAD binding domain-containing protein n=1 Tax=Evansella sp. AB-P1 TaxID=3037653 RepID=UPI00241E99BE|nr:FAD binding domain-containing protein [Evansella sp. AB-P1]MDG5787915.1 FAD binding domain-containing protein [Evansella sp. AB-P1]